MATPRGCILGRHGGLECRRVAVVFLSSVCNFQCFDCSHTAGLGEEQGDRDFREVALALGYRSRNRGAYQTAVDRRWHSIPCLAIRCSPFGRRLLVAARFAGKAAAEFVEGHKCASQPGSCKEIAPAGWTLVVYARGYVPLSEWLVRDGLLAPGPPDVSGLW